VIELHVEPRVVRSWEDFRRETPACSLALDGYVSGAPRFAPEGPHANFNHHEGVDRLATRSTAAQVMLTVKQGLFDAFRSQDGPFAHVYVNDADQDTSLSVWLLRNQERIAGSRGEPLLSRLVFCSDMMDATAGAYPFPPESKIVRELGWIYAPYEEARQSGKLLTMNAGELAAVIDAVGERIHAYSLGRGRTVRLDTRYQVLYRGKGWAMVRELGAQARTRVFQDGLKAFVAVRERPDGAYLYSIGRMSPLVAFPLERLYQALNLAEGIGSEDPDRWGGSNTIGGSPRQRGSRLAPEALAEHIEGILAG
jgi:hypothetical protein